MIGSRLLRKRAWASKGCGLLLAAAGALQVQAADTPQATDFAWRATLNVPPGVSLARVDVPVQALLGMRSPAAHDVRVFNATGAVVPFALLGGADLKRTAPVAQTNSYKAYPLFSTSGDRKPARGAVSVQLDTTEQTSNATTNVWVRWDRSDMRTKAADAAASTQPLQAALFDLRGEKQTLAALELVLDMPRNALVPITVATSTDLKDWTPVATKGPLFQFDGTDAPGNNTLELLQPLAVQGRYLRLSWQGQVGVELRALTGTVAESQTAAAPLRAALPPGTADGSNALNWTLPFATPIAALHLQAVQNNSLVPVRILGRNEAAQPWRTLASSVVYRLDGVGQGSSNPPAALHGTSLHSLRVEAGKGMALPEGGMQATVEFAPMQVAFLTSGLGPFTLAVGRAQTAMAAVDASLLGSVTPAKLIELPLATLSDVVVQTPPNTGLDGAASRWLPDGVSLRSVLLWLVLGVGVMALGAVAYSLMRQMSAKG
nr:DUF3999 family protein [uncultured Rhodoferax sp.]